MSNLATMNLPSEISEPHLRRYLDKFAGMSVEELDGVLVDVQRVTADAMLRGAAVLCIMRDKGIDIAEKIKAGLLKICWLVANGRIDPELAERLMHRPQLIAMVRGLPLSEQQKLVSPDGYEVVEPDGENGFTKRIYRIGEFSKSPELLRQIVAEDHLRNNTEQKLFLERAIVANRRRRSPKVKEDLVAGHVEIAGITYSIRQMRDFIRRYEAAQRATPRA